MKQRKRPLTFRDLLAQPNIAKQLDQLGKPSDELLDTLAALRENLPRIAGMVAVLHLLNGEVQVLLSGTARGDSLIALGIMELGKGIITDGINEDGQQ